MRGVAFALAIGAFGTGCELDVDVDHDTACPEESEAFVSELLSPSATLDPRGFAWLELTASDTLEVHLRSDRWVQDWNANAVILGFEDASLRARCPSPAQDTDGDVRIVVSEAIAVTGGPVLALATVAPTDAAGNFDIDVTRDAAGTAPLTNRVLAIVMSPPGDIANQVVACGEIRRATSDDPVWFDDLSVPAAPPGIIGSGGLSTESGVRVELDANLLCDAPDFRQDLVIDIGANTTFTLGALESAVCTDGTYTGTGTGNRKTVTPTSTTSELSRIQFTLVDGSPDRATFVIDRFGGNVDTYEGALDEGEIEAH